MRWYVIMVYLEVIPSSLQCCLEIPLRKASCFLGTVPKASGHFQLCIKRSFVLWAQYTASWSPAIGYSYVDAMTECMHEQGVCPRHLLWRGCLILPWPAGPYTRWDCSSPGSVRSLWKFSVVCVLPFKTATLKMSVLESWIVRSSLEGGTRGRQCVPACGRCSGGSLLQECSEISAACCLAACCGTSAKF